MEVNCKIRHDCSSKLPHMLSHVLTVRGSIPQCVNQLLNLWPGGKNKFAGTLESLLDECADHPQSFSVIFPRL
uniref:Uncharacterized protein n=1 Tax=Arundo donax TaxID=35708 RepID=A0A0A8Y4E2_ARUDO